MRKLLILGTVLLVFAGALFFAAINLNQYLEENREWLSEQASAALGRSVAFDEIGVSFRGGLGARVTDVSIGEDSDFGQGAFLRADRVDAVIKILPALRGNYEVARVEIDAPKINVIKTSAGFNFDSLGRSADDRARNREKEDSAAGALPLLVSSLLIQDGELRYIDRSSSPASELNVAELDFSASDIGLDRLIQLKLAAALLGATEQNVRVEGTLGPAEALEDAARAPIDLRVDLGPLVVDRLKQLALIGESIPAELSSPDPIALNATLSGSFDAPRALVSLDATDASVVYGDLFTKPRGVRLAVDADVKQAGDTFDFSDLDLHIAKAHLTGSGHIGLKPDLSVDCKLLGRDVPLDGWGRLIPAAAAVEATGAVDLDADVKWRAGTGSAPSVFGTLALRQVGVRHPESDTRIEGLATTLTFKGNRVEIPPTDFKLNGNAVRVAATVKNLSNIDTDFQITSPTLDIAALGVADKTVKRAEVIENFEARGNFHNTGSGAQIDVSLRSDGGSVRDIAYRALDAKISAGGPTVLTPNRFTLDQLAVSTFDGSITGSGSYDMAKPDAPAFAFRGNVNGVDVGALASHFGAGRVLQMAGRLKADFDLNGSGTEWAVISQALTGNGALEVEDGLLKGVNIAESILGELTGIPGLSNLVSPNVRGKYPELFGMDDTVFEALRGKAKLGNGEALLDQVALAARDYRLDGQGTVQLNNVLDIAMTFVASQGLSADLIRSVKEIRYLTDANGRFNLPLRLGGSMPSFRVQPDMRYVTQQLSASLVQTGISKGLDALLGKPKKQQAPASGDPAAQSGQPAGSNSEAPAEANTAQPAEPDAEQAAPPPDPAEELIRRGLGALLGGDQD